MPTINIPKIRTEGTYENYINNLENYKNTLYFATDVKKLFYNNIDYSSCIVDGSVDETKLSEVLKDKINSVDDKISNVKSEIIDGANEDWDTLKEVGDWIDSHNIEYNNLQKKVNNKVDKEDNKGLSTNDFTTFYKTKLDSIEIQEQSDWNETNMVNKSYIKNKPTKLSSFENDCEFVQNKDLNTAISHSVGSLIEVVLDSSKYDNIINTADGLINVLKGFVCGINVTKTDFKNRAHDIKFIRLTNLDNTRTTILNVVFVMPAAATFCGYGFNKLDGTYIGIGYATISYDSETTVKITSIRSTLPIDS